MEQMHSMLKRQIGLHFGGPDSLPKEWQGFIDAVNGAYFEFDADRSMLERSRERTSQELLEMSSEVRAIFERLVDSSMDGIFAFDRESATLSGILPSNEFWVSTSYRRSAKPPSMSFRS